MSKTKIEWSEMSWNPITGCTPISIGCKNCYAERICYRFWKAWGYDAPPDHFKVRCHPDRLEQPLKWRKPSMVFVCSMGDLFHEDVPDEFIDQVLFVIGKAKRHTFQLLTKRPERMYHYFNALTSGESSAIHRIIKQLGYSGFHGKVLDYRRESPLQNLWLGTSVSTQKDADENIPWLLKTPAAIRFVSYEPALEKIDFTHTFDRAHIDWLICGGESGPGARPMHPDWARSARDQCVKAGISFFFKQQGEWYPVHDRFKLSLPKDDKRIHEFGDGVIAVRVGKKKAGRLLDGIAYDEYPITPVDVNRREAIVTEELKRWRKD